MDDPSEFSHSGKPVPKGSYVPPESDHYTVAFCGHCPNAHILFYNIRGEGICQAVLTARQVRDILVEILAIDPNFREAPL